MRCQIIQNGLTVPWTPVRVVNGVAPPTYFLDPREHIRKQTTKCSLLSRKYVQVMLDIASATVPVGKLFTELPRFTLR